jgi:hypothetical protein
MPHALQVVPPSIKDTTAFPDGILHLARNLNIHPDTLIGKGTGIFGAGMIGAGKTTVMARLFEQFGRCGLPFAIFDLEGDLASLVPLLPRGVLATASNCPSVKELYQEGLQVVFALESFEMEHAADMMMATVDGLMQHTEALPPHVRVPFLIGIDEIAYFVPQKRAGHEHLSSDRLKALHACLSSLVSRGRKRGLVPCFFTQRFAHVHKDVLSPGTFILMRNTLDTDLTRYMEYIDASAFGDGSDLTLRQVKARIAKFKEGQGIIKLPSGKQGVVQFYNRESEHTSHAPKTQAAINAYRDVVVDKQKQYGAFVLECEEQETVQAASVPTQTRGQTIGDQEATASLGLAKETVHDVEVKRGPTLPVLVAPSQHEPLRPPEWGDETVKLLIGFFRVLDNLDKSLHALGMSTSQHNRDAARAILKQQGLWKGNRLRRHDNETDENGGKLEDADEGNGVTRPIEQDTSMPIPILPRMGPRAEEIDLAAAITLWNNGHNSHRKLMKAFDMTQHQAGRLAQIIREQAKVCRK